MEDFSLNLLCRNKSHLVPLTLDSLKAQNGSFEILILDGAGNGKLQEILHRYEGLHIRIENCKVPSLAAMMNMGLALSRGKYVQFLQPGERYISQYGFSYLTEKIASLPAILSARGVSQESCSHWFLRTKLLEMGGFNEKISTQPLFDLLCRYHKQGIDPISCNRVLVDAPIEKIPIFETCQILYHHFGLKSALKWLFQGRAGNLHRAAAFFKDAFRGRSQ